MPIRFRKSLSLGKGLRLNFSKRGMSLSQRIGNFTLNSSGRMGASIPGTGISAYTQIGKTSKRQSKNDISVQMWVGLIIGFILIMCCICFGFYLLLTPTTDNSSTPTPVFINTEPSPIILATTTSISNPIFVPTFTVTSVPAPTLAPTWTPEPTFTPFVLPTVQIINPPANTKCSCNSDKYNCSDFSSQSSAQACFNTCVAEGKGDIHRLDENNDGIACESN